jgi:hypothetical protein
MTRQQFKLVQRIGGRLPERFQSTFFTLVRLEAGDKKLTDRENYRIASWCAVQTVLFGMHSEKKRRR